jgi:hypothetical protein
LVGAGWLEGFGRPLSAGRHSASRGGSADRLMGTGASPQAHEERDTTLYSLVEAGPDPVVVRADRSQPVSELLHENRR